MQKWAVHCSASGLPSGTVEYTQCLATEEIHWQQRRNASLSTLNALTQSLNQQQRVSRPSHTGRLPPGCRLVPNPATNGLNWRCP
jgi:hypothetical protein